MPSRIVCGEAIWRSKKLLSVPEEYRPFYAILLTTAEANGSFEADPKRVWADVFSYNLPHITPDIVSEILDAFENADMLLRWEQDGRVWGFWIGIDKPGRLPPESRLYRYKGLPPDPPPELKEKRTVVPEPIVPEPAAEDNGSRVKQKGLNPLKHIPTQCREILGVRAENESWYREDLKELAQTYGGTEVVTAFETWAKTVKKAPRNPVKEFIRVADQYLQNRVLTEDPTLDALCVSLYHIGNKPFTDSYRVELNSLLVEFSFSEIEKAYKDFVSTKDDYEMKFAPKDFCTGGCKAIVLANRQKQEQAERQAAFMESETAKMQSQVAKELDAAEEIVEEEL